MAPGAGGLDVRVEIVAARGNGQDRASVCTVPGGLVVVLADGAGGSGAGDRAAQAIVDGVEARAVAGADWLALLATLDRALAAHGRGQSTAVVLAIVEGQISGASVGDSEAWVVFPTGVVELTEGQDRKPLVGAGDAVPRPLQKAALAGGTLVVASDGLWNYARRADIVRVALLPELADVAGALVDLVRLPSGAVPDDVAIVLVRDGAPP
jgi:serine/threonine protein phosphatase PrpC